MKNVIVASALVLLMFIAVSCEKVKGKGEVVSQNREISGYSGVSLSMDADVYYVAGPQYSMQLNGQQNVLDVVETPVENGRVVLKYKNGVIVGKHDKVVVNITAPGLNSFIVSGSGNMNIDYISEPSAELTISGSGNITLNNILADNLDCTISGSGNINVNAGTVNYGDLNISGSGSLKMSNLVIDTAYARISGSGSMELNVQKLLDATISGSGSIHYSGTPVVNTHISGSGSVVHN